MAQPLDASNIVQVVATVMDVQLPQGISTAQVVAKTAKPTTDLELTDAEFIALAKKRGITLPRTAKPGGHNPGYNANPSRSQSYHCEYHGTNMSHHTAGCHYLNPHLRPASSRPPQVFTASTKDPIVDALLATLSSHLANSRLGQSSSRSTPQLDVVVGPNPPAYSGPSGQRPHNQANGQSASLFCTHCQQTGHLEDRCWKKHPELSPYPPQQRSSPHPFNPPPFQGPSGQRSYNQANGQRSSLLCVHCRRTGHLEDTCWHKHPELAPPEYQPQYCPPSSHPPQVYTASTEGLIVNARLATESTRPGGNVTDAELEALAKKRGFTLTPIAKPTRCNQSANPNPSTSGEYYCEHHGRNQSHFTPSCHVLNPHLKTTARSGRPPAQVHTAPTARPPVDALLATLSSLFADGWPGQVRRRVPPQVEATVSSIPPGYVIQGPSVWVANATPGPDATTLPTPSLHLLSQSGTSGR